MITVRGKISMRNGTPSVTAEEVIPWKVRGEQAEENNSQKLCLRFDTKDIDLYNKISSTLNAYPGDTEVVIKCTAVNKPFAYNQKVDVGNYLLNELYGIIGTDNVKLFSPKAMGKEKKE